MESRNVTMPRSSDPQLLLAVDGGGTKTRCVVYTLDGERLADVEGGPSNHLSAGRSRTLESLRETLARSLEQCNFGAESVRLLSAGFAGVDADGAGADEMKAVLAEIGYHRALVNGDMVTAHAGAFEGQPGVLALAGTGAVFFGVSESGEKCKAGGYGYCFGDEGAGYWIAVEALRAASKAHDGRAEPTALVESLCRSFDVAQFSRILVKIYSQPIRARELARLSPIVEEAATQGDPVAVRILKNAGRELAIGTVSVARALGYLAGCPVSYQGGVLRRCSLVLQTFREEILVRLPGAQVQAPLFEATHGAYILGLRLINSDLARNR